MLRATSIVRKPAVKPDKVADTLTLDHEARNRRRFAMTGEGGLAFLLDLDRATALEDGDALKLEDGRLVRVAAAPERLIEVRTASPLRLMKVAWHLGNRHVAAEITDDVLFIRHDHVLLEMVRGLGASAAEVTRPFRPERGAYEGGQDGHDHSGHEHSDHHGGAHEHAEPNGDAHAHGPDCGCGHDHAHHHHHEDLHHHGATHHGAGKAEHGAAEHDHAAHAHAEKAGGGPAHGHAHGSHGHRHD